MRLGIVMLFWVISLNIYAQIPVDSALILQEVTVMGNFEKQFLPGNNIIISKAKTLQFYQSDNISEVLRQQSSIHIKEYGNGMLSTIAFRGTNASQTSVLWNNFNINSYTLGLTDFSLIPTQAVDEITLIPGSGSSMGGDGAFGGSVLLQNNLDFNSNKSISLSQQAGSFGQCSSDINAKGSFNKWAFDTKLYWGKSDNDFEQLSTGRKQNNAYFERKGFNQTIGYKINQGSKLKVAIWYNDNFREIQPPIGSTRNINNQEDKNLRSTINYEYSDNNGRLSIGSGFFQDELTYRSDQSVSYFRVNRIESFADYKSSLSKHQQIKVSVRHNFINAENEEYDRGVATEERYSLGLQMKGRFLMDAIDYAVHVRQQIVSGVRIPVSPYAGLSALVWNEKNHKLQVKTNSSYNFRLPTLNDRFWNELGNPVLLSETGWNKELGLLSQHQIGNAQIETSVTAFHNLVNNWIQWTPDTTGQFRPRNIKKVLARGIESSVAVEMPLGGKWIVQTNLHHSFTQSTVIETEGNQREVGKQLIYTPFNKANGSFSLVWNNFSFNSFHQWTGKVYTTNTNSEIYALEAFFLADVGISWQSVQWKISGRAKNVFNRDYRVYSGYAMPGRNYQLSIQYQLNFKNQ